MAPVMTEEEEETPDDMMDELDQEMLLNNATNLEMDDKLNQILKEVLLSNATNLDIIKKDFNTLSDVYGEVTYSIICSIEDNCSSSADYSITWTTVDPTTFSGGLLNGLAAMNWHVPFFEWKHPKTSLLLDLTSLPAFCYNDTETSLSTFCYDDTETSRTTFCYNDTEINASLSHLTQQVSYA